MKLSTLKKDIWYLIVYILGVLGCLIVASSCTSVKKLRSNVHQEIVKTETVNKSDTKDSTSKTVVKQIDSSGITVTVVYDSTSADTAISFDIITFPPSKDQYTERISIKSSVKPKSITVNKAAKKTDEKFDSTVKKSLTVENVNKEEKTVSKIKTVEKKKVVFHWWWFVLIGLVAVGIYYRKPIRNFIIKIISPL